MMELEQFRLDGRFGPSVGEASNGDVESCCEDDTSDFVSQGLFFSGLKTKDRAKRNKTLDAICTCMEEWASNKEDAKAQKYLKMHLPIILRISTDCPFSDVCERFTKLLERLKTKNTPVPSPAHDSPSSFIPSRDVVSICSAPGRSPMVDQAMHLFEDAFVSDLRVSHLIQLMGYHPEYLDVFLKTHQLLMKGDGPLPVNMRIYIAIMAASRHRCGYLVSVLEMEFLIAGGNKDWIINGKEQMPGKLRNLQTINRLMAHQPWTITRDHIKDLLIGHDSWSIAEFSQAIVIIATYHALAGFSLGCGLTPEVDTPFGHTYGGIGRNLSNPALCLLVDQLTDSEGSVSGSGFVSPSDSYSTPPSGYLNEIPTLATKRVEHFLQSNHEEETKLSVLLKQQSDSSDEETAEQRDAYYAESISTANLDTKAPAQVPIPPVVSKYLDEPNFTHEDTLSLAKMRSSEYSWEDHGFALVSRFYSEAATLLDEKFDIAADLTYNTVGGKKGVDTEPFRRAIWYYIQSIKGIRRDDYNYKEVNKLLTIPFKTYIKTVACFPEQLHHLSFESLAELGLHYSERVHINFIVLEARLQAELLYTLKSLMENMKV